ncbi:unnamed protein product [Gadus morhua 'NCC']
MSSSSPEYASFFAVMGASSAMVFSALGAAYGTAKSGTGIAAMSVMRPELIMKSIIPVVMAGIIAIYGLVVAVLIANNIADNITLYKSFLHLGAGLSVGLSGLAAGFRHRHRGGRGCAGHGPAAPAVRGHDPDPDLRRGPGAQEQTGDVHLIPEQPAVCRAALGGVVTGTTPMGGVSAAPVRRWRQALYISMGA